jgi:hypothetical protein
MFGLSAVRAAVLGRARIAVSQAGLQEYPSAVPACAAGGPEFSSVSLLAMSGPWKEPRSFFRLLEGVAGAVSFLTFR